MEIQFKRVPVWLMTIAVISAIFFLGFGVVTGRQVSLWPPVIGPAGSAERCPSFSDLANGDLKKWRFGRSNGEQITSKFMLGAGGQVSGYDHPNERRWEVVGNELRVFGETGQLPTTIYKTIRCYRVVELVGNAGVEFSHILTRPLQE